VIDSVTLIVPRTDDPTRRKRESLQATLHPRTISRFRRLFSGQVRRIREGRAV
jgi:hypothetical protein